MVHSFRTGEADAGARIEVTINDDVGSGEWKVANGGTLVDAQARKPDSHVVAAKAP